MCVHTWYCAVDYTNLSKLFKQRLCHFTFKWLIRFLNNKDHKIHKNIISFMWTNTKCESIRSFWSFRKSIKSIYPNLQCDDWTRNYYPKLTNRLHLTNTTNFIQLRDAYKSSEMMYHDNTHNMLRFTMQSIKANQM